MTTDVSPVPTTGTECGAEWPVNEIALAIARLRISGPG
jgi:hypothetical protein